MMARVARIVPLYWVLTLLFVALLEIVPNVFTHARLNFWNVVASFLFLPAINWAGIIAPVIDVGWTLNYEAWFYGVFAVAMCITRRPLVAVAAFFGLTSLLRFAPGSSVPFLFYTDPIVLEFVAGCGIGTYHAKGKGFSPRMSLAILFGVLAVMLLYGPMLNNNRIIVSGVPALALVISVLALESKIRWSRFLCNLGDASYSLYLTQVFSVPFTLKLLQMIDRQRLLAGDLVSVVVTIVAIAAGFACHELVERPGMRLTNRR